MIEHDVIGRIQELCDHRHWSLYKLAQKSNLPYSSINNIFVRGTCPTIITLEKICDGFDISLSDFFLFVEPVPHDEKLTDDEADVLYGYRSLSASDKRILRAYLQGLCKK